MIAKPWTAILKPDVLFKKPLLIGGLGLTFGVSLWNTVIPHPTDFLTTVTWGTIALGAGYWWLNRSKKTTVAPTPVFPTTVDREAVVNALTDVEAFLQQLVKEISETATNSKDYDGAMAQRHSGRSIARLHTRHQDLSQALDRRNLHCALVGAKGVGKTTLLQHLTNHGWLEEAVPLSFADTPALLTLSSSESINRQQGLDTLSELSNTDVVLFVTEGDITASELATIQELLDQRFEVTLVFNKQDRYLPQDCEDIINRLRQRLHPHLAIEAVVATTAVASSIKVRQHQPDGTVEERWEQIPLQVMPLTERLQYLSLHESEWIVLKTTLRQIHGLRGEIQQLWNQLRRDRARPVVEKYQWIAAATAFANPLPTFDLVATGAINAQLVADLGGVYQQNLTLEQGKVVMVTLAELMVKLGLVELTTQAITPLLKSHTLTFAAGGALQGLSAAYFTHVAGISLIQYFEEQSQLQQADGTTATDGLWNRDRLGQIMQQVFQTCQRGDFLQNLVEQGIRQFGYRPGGSSQAQSPVVTP